MPFDFRLFKQDVPELASQQLHQLLFRRVLKPVSVLILAWVEGARISP